MDFTISDEQTHLVDVARSFSRERIAPFYRQREAEGAFDRPTLLEMGRLGFFGLELPEEVGGLGQDCVTAGLVLEALSAGDYNVGYIPVTISLCGQILQRYGQPEAVLPWLEKMISGEVIPCVALTEPAGGSDAANLSLKAVRDGSDYLISGEKTSISMAAQADVAIVFARTGTRESRARGVSAFLVPLDDPSVSRTTFSDHGGRSAGRGTLHFEDTRVPSSYLLGDENAGFGQVMAGFDYSRALIGIQSLGVARQSLDETWEYARSRVTFGQPLVERQGVAFPLAEAETHYAAARLLCLQTLWLKDRGLPHTNEAAMCKWWAPKLAHEIVLTCLLTHGHAGYSGELPFEQRLRDLLGLQIGDGTAQIMKMIISKRKAAGLG